MDLTGKGWVHFEGKDLELFLHLKLCIISQLRRLILYIYILHISVCVCYCVFHASCRNDMK